MKTHQNEPVEATERGHMTDARKARIHAKRKGICRVCKLPVDQLGPNVVYDHLIPLWMNGPDSDANIWPLHADPCNKLKTKKDKGDIARAKRRNAFHTGTRPETKAKIRSRGFQKTRAEIEI